MWRHASLGLSNLHVFWPLLNWTTQFTVPTHEHISRTEQEQGDTFVIFWCTHCLTLTYSNDSGPITCGGAYRSSTKRFSRTSVQYLRLNLFMWHYIHFSFFFFPFMCVCIKYINSVWKYNGRKWAEGGAHHHHLEPSSADDLYKKRERKTENSLIKWMQAALIHLFSLIWIYLETKAKQRYWNSFLFWDKGIQWLEDFFFFLLLQVSVE